MLSSLDCLQDLSPFEEISGCPQGSQDDWTSQRVLPALEDRRFYLLLPK